jgi:hypothetical protein
MELVERQPDLTPAEIQAELARAGLSCSQGAIWRFSLFSPHGMRQLFQRSRV